MISKTATHAVGLSLCTVLHDQAPRHPSTYTVTAVRDQTFEDKINQNPTFCEPSLVPAKVSPAPEQPLRLML